MLDAGSTQKCRKDLPTTPMDTVPSNPSFAMSSSSNNTTLIDVETATRTLLPNLTNISWIDMKASLDFVHGIKLNKPNKLAKPHTIFDASESDESVKNLEFEKGKIYFCNSNFIILY